MKGPAADWEENVRPAKEAEIKKQAARFRELVPWVAKLRRGAGQEAYEAEARKFLGHAREAEAGREDYAALAVRLAAVRIAWPLGPGVFLLTARRHGT